VAKVEHETMYMSLLLRMARSGDYRDVADIETALALKEMHIGAEFYRAPLRNRLNALCKAAVLRKLKSE